MQIWSVWLFMLCFDTEADHWTEKWPKKIRHMPSTCLERWQQQRTAILRHMPQGLVPPEFAAHQLCPPAIKWGRTAYCLKSQCAHKHTDTKTHKNTSTDTDTLTYTHTKYCMHSTRNSRVLAQVITDSLNRDWVFFNYAFEKFIPNQSIQQQ